MKKQQNLAKRALAMLLAVLMISGLLLAAGITFTASAKRPPPAEGVTHDLKVPTTADMQMYSQLLVNRWEPYKVNNWSPSNIVNKDVVKRLGFSYNVVRQTIEAFGEPARLQSPEFGVGKVLGSADNDLGYWNGNDTRASIELQKQLNSGYMLRDESLPAQYKGVFLHDYYLQGILDAAPGTYGTFQDKYTEPGAIVKNLASSSGGGLMWNRNRQKVTSEISGKSYANSLSGANPWWLNNYIATSSALTDNYTKVVKTAFNGMPTDEVAPANGILGTVDNWQNKWYYGYDEVAQCCYLWNPNPATNQGGAFISYENELSMKERCEYIKENNLGGIIIWEMSEDLASTYPLMTTLSSELFSDPTDKKNIVGYYTNWSVYSDLHQKQHLMDLPVDKMTHINYGFFQVGGYQVLPVGGSSDGSGAIKKVVNFPANTIQSCDDWADDWTVNRSYGETVWKTLPWDLTGAHSMLLDEINILKGKNPDIKILPSVGGWTRGDGFYQMVVDPASRETFAKSCAAFVQKYNFDGIDLDWEYPSAWRLADFDDPADLGSAGDSYNDYDAYIEMVKVLRNELPSGSLVTAVSPAAGSKISAQDMLGIIENCDFVNAMTYDYHGAFDPIIGYNSPLYRPNREDIQGNEFYDSFFKDVGWTNDETHEDFYDDFIQWSVDYTVDYFRDVVLKDVADKDAIMGKINIGTAFYSRGWAGVKADEDGMPMGLTDVTPFGLELADPEIVSVSVEVANSTVVAGSDPVATATITKKGTPDTSLTWKIEKKDANGNWVATTGAAIADDSKKTTTTPTITTTEKGEYRVTATSVFDETKSGSATFTVTSVTPPSNLQLKVNNGVSATVALNGLGNLVVSLDLGTDSVTKVEWTITSPGAADWFASTETTTLSNTVTGKAAGTATIKAKVYFTTSAAMETNTVEFIVKDDSPVGFEVTPVTALAKVGEAVMLSGWYVYADGSKALVPAGAIKWTLTGGTGSKGTLFGGVWTFNSTAVKDDTVVISGEVTGFAAKTSTITCNEEPDLDDPFVKIQEKGVVLKAGEEKTFTAKVTDENGNVVTPNPAYTWSATTTGYTTADFIDYDPSTGKVTVIAATDEDIIVTLTVTVADGDYKGLTDTVTFTIKAAEVVPDEPVTILVRLNNVEAAKLVTDDKIEKFAVDPKTPTVSAFTLNNKTMLPVRFVENLGAEVKWNGATEPVNVSYKGIELILEFGNSNMKRIENGVEENVELPTAPSLVEGKTYVPIREIAEGIGFVVRYDAATYSAVVTNQELTEAKRKELHKWAASNMPTVIEPIRSISAKNNTISMSKGGSKAVILGHDDINYVTKTGAAPGCNLLLFSSNNEAVATVTSQGRIVGQSKGTAIITVKSHNGKETQITVTVN